MTTTYGFELEYARGVARLTSKLYDLGLVRGGPTPHSYHCDCDYCEDVGVPFRVQRDWSCDGEVISCVMSADDKFSSFTGKGDVSRMMAVVRELRPNVQMSTTTGLHVHVGRGIGSTVELDEMLRMVEAYMLVEEHVNRIIAPASFEHKRPSMNLTIARAIQRWTDYERLDIHDHLSHTRVAKAAIAAMSHDRHCDLNWDYRRTGTAEVRAYNSTMFAWRLELACRLSVLLLDESSSLCIKAFGAASTTMHVETYLTDNMFNRGGALRKYVPSPLAWPDLVGWADAHDSRLAELLDRQYAYHQERY